MEQAQKWLAQLTLEEKASLCSGASTFSTQAIERLGIPSITFADGPHGLRKQSGAQDHLGRNASDIATCFPSACATGSSWNRKLLERMGHALGQASQAADVQVLLGPGVNMKRSPLCGRNFEYFSEDPYHAGQLGVAYVKGVQAEGVGTSLKHFIANNQETRRRTQDSRLDERTLREIYAPAFETVVKEAQPWTVMAAYNKVNGIYATEHSKLLRQLLVDEWGYDGLVVSDWMAVHDRLAVIEGGCALTMPSDKGCDQVLVDAVQSGQLDAALLDEACLQILCLIEKSMTHRRPDTEYDFEAGHDLAKQLAVDSMVLLKNEDKVLPIDPQQRVAIIGPFADEPRYQGAGSSKVNPYRVTSLKALTEAYPNVHYATGFGLGNKTNPDLLSEAIDLAKSADVAIILAGLPPILESEGYDRWVMKLPECQLEAISAISKVQPRTIVVLQNGSPVDLSWRHQVKGILECYLGGEAINEALWEILIGQTNPSGHLAETFPERLEDNPSYLTWPGEGDIVTYNEGVFIGYRYYSTKQLSPAYPFGYGLSYTDFTYEDLVLSQSEFKAGDLLQASVKVTNTGEVEGQALVQLYVSPTNQTAEVKRPIRELRAFEKINLVPGESQTVTLNLDSRAFSYWDQAAHSFRVASGSYDVEVCAHADEVILHKDITVVDQYLPKEQNFHLMTPIIDIIKHPEGKALVDRVLPTFRGVVKKLGVMNENGEDIPYAELRPAESGLMAEPLQTLTRFVPDMTQEDWEAFLVRLNQK